MHITAHTDHQELYKRKFGALGARDGSIAFIDVDAPGPALLTSQPEAHAVVFATDSDVFVSFRGLTNIDSALSENGRFTPVEGSFGGERVPVHGGFYRSFAAVWPGVAAAMQKAVAATARPHEAKIWLAGHSMGGAHALFAALRLTDMRKPVGGVYLYGAPKVRLANKGRSMVHVPQPVAGWPRRQQPADNTLTTRPRMPCPADGAAGIY